ncbi:hypothetical protein EV426DRAFT_388187 [Tirmania nivea]|nr:hypothetical protein EV426DRAFT_388187 [Tirmania nivea]
MFSKRTSVAAGPASEPLPPAAGCPDRSSTASTTTTSRSSIFSTFSAISAISTFSNKSNATATKSPGAEPEEEEFNPVDITPLIAPGPTVTDASVFFPRNPNSKHLAHLTALNTGSTSASTAPSTNASTAASTSTSPAPSIRATVQTPATSASGATTLNLPPLTLPNLSTPTTPTLNSAHGPISPTPSSASHFSFPYAPSFHGSVIGINNLPNIPQATVTRVVQTYFTIQALKVVGYQAAVAGRCAGIVHRVPFAFGGMEEAEEDWELGGGDLVGDSGVDLVLSRIDDLDGATEEPVEEVLAKRFPQWFYLEDRQEVLVADNASILSGEAGILGHRRSRSHPNPGEIAIPDSISPPSTAGGTRSRSGTTTTITPPQPQKQLFFHDPSNLLNASFAAFSFSSPNSASGATPPIDFSSVISFAADHPPPPVSPTGGETTTSSAAASEAGDDVAQAVTLRTPLPFHLHHLHSKSTLSNHQKHPYTWLPPLSQTTLSKPNPTIGVELGGVPHPIPVPTLPLPTLLITSLLTAHGLLRSLTMGDRKVGNIALRQAVNLASFVRMRGGVGSASEGGGAVSLPGGVPKDALGVLARLRGEKGNEERRVVLWALRCGVVATDPPHTSGMSPVQVHAHGKHQYPGGLKRTYTAGANNHLRELVLVSRREGEAWRRSAPAAVMDYRSPSGAATPSIRSFSGVSVTSMGPGRNSMRYVEEEQVGEDGEVRAAVNRVSLDSQAGEMAELRREMGGSEAGEVLADKELLSPVEPTGAKKASMRWSFKAWGGGNK